MVLQSPLANAGILQPGRRLHPQVSAPSVKERETRLAILLRHRARAQMRVLAYFSGVRHEPLARNECQEGLSSAAKNRLARKASDQHKWFSPAIAKS